MERSQYDLLEVLDHIEPAELDYQQWLNIGMALDLEGYSVDVWDNWSRRDPGRYHPGECQKKWKGFKGNGSPVTGGTIVQYARDRGGRRPMIRGMPWAGKIPFPVRKACSLTGTGWREKRYGNRPVLTRPRN